MRWAVERDRKKRGYKKVPSYARPAPDKSYFLSALSVRLNIPNHAG